MKTLLSISLVLLITVTNGFAQVDSTHIDSPLGRRILRNGKDYIIYSDQGFTINSNDYRKINYQVYFRIISTDPIQGPNGKSYQLITIPGTSSIQNQNNKGLQVSVQYPRAGRLIGKEDYDQNFWIEVDVIEKHTQEEYYKWANDVFSGLLTAPFKYRLKAGDAPEALIDGDFNVAPFIGWKWRISSSKPYYIAPFGFSGITTLNFNSANNTKITDPEILENGTGLTYGGGISIRLGNVSPGFVIGWDKGFGNLGSGFLYNGKPWISFSINYDLFSPKQTAAGNQD